MPLRFSLLRKGLYVVAVTNSCGGEKPPQFLQALTRRVGFERVGSPGKLVCLANLIERPEGLRDLPMLEMLAFDRSTRYPPPVQQRRGWSMLILLIGIVVFLGVHSLTTLRETRTRLIEWLGPGPFKGLYSLVAIAGFVLIVWGFSRYRAEGLITLWTPPTWTRDLAIASRAGLIQQGTPVPMRHRATPVDYLVWGVGRSRCCQRSHFVPERIPCPSPRAGRAAVELKAPKRRHARGGAGGGR